MVLYRKIKTLAKVKYNNNWKEHVKMSSKEIQKFLLNYPTLSYDNLTNKVRCSLSGHEMPCRVDAIESYVRGKKFQKLLARDDSNFEKYKSHLVPSTKKHHEHQLFCTLTMTHVNKTPAHVERHVNGAKYKRCLARWEECQRTGREYRPPQGRRKMQENLDLSKGVNSVGEGGEDDEGEISDADSLSDLYPAVDGFQIVTEEDGEIMQEGGASGAGSDSDFEDMDTEEKPKSAHQHKGQKRQNMKGARHQKQMKKKKQKVS